MSGNTESFTRSLALDRALQWAEKHGTRAPGDYVSSDTIVVAAEKFRAFLAGEAKETPTVPDLPVFVLPKIGDHYTYFKALFVPGVLYRSDTRVHSMVPSAERIRVGLGRDDKWGPALSDRLRTRDQLRNHEEYQEITAPDARRLIKEKLKGVRFE